MSDLTPTKLKIKKFGYCKYCSKPTGKMFKVDGNICFSCKKEKHLQRASVCYLKKKMI